MVFFFFLSLISFRKQHSLRFLEQNPVKVSEQDPPRAGTNPAGVPRGCSVPPYPPALPRCPGAPPSPGSPHLLGAPGPLSLLAPAMCRLGTARHSSVWLGTARHRSPTRGGAQHGPARLGAERSRGAVSRAEPSRAGGRWAQQPCPRLKPAGSTHGCAPRNLWEPPRGGGGRGEHGRSQHRGDAPRSPPRARLGSSTRVAPMAPIACGAPGMAAAAVMVGKQSSVSWQHGVRTGGAAAITARGRGVQEGQ